MTEQEAMEIIMQVAYDGEFPLNSNEAFGIACKALEKHIPQAAINKTKPDNGVATKYENCNVVVCPACKGRLKVKSKGNYCDKCGQALVWK